jgi:hypothetical protein
MTNHTDETNLNAELHRRLFNDGDQEALDYGTSWEAMGRVVEAMRTRPEEWELELLCLRGGVVNARFTSSTERTASAAATSAPAAVCQAALDALRTYVRT